MILLIREHSLNIKTAEILTKLGYQVLQLPLTSLFMSLNKSAYEEINLFEQLIITSQQGAKALLYNHEYFNILNPNFPIMTVGKQPKILLSPVFNNIKSYNNVAELTKNLLLSKKYIYFSGKNITYDISQHYDCKRVIIYSLSMNKVFLPASIQYVNAVLIYSKQSFVNFFQLLNNNKAINLLTQIKICAISNEICKFITNSYGLQTKIFDLQDYNFIFD
jgi:uroporphyrinogen-III synthase